MPANVFDFSNAPEIAYLDSSFLLNILIEDSHFHKECKEYVQKLKDKDTQLITSNLTLDEIWYVLLKVFAIRDYPEEKWQNKLKSNPGLVKKYAEEIEIHTNNLLRIPNLSFVSAPTKVVVDSLNLIKQYGLFPRDAIHVNMVLSKINNIITTDSDFCMVSGINVYIPLANKFQK